MMEDGLMGGWRSVLNQGLKVGGGLAGLMGGWRFVLNQGLKVGGGRQVKGCTILSVVSNSSPSPSADPDCVGPGSAPSDPTVK